MVAAAGLGRWFVSVAVSLSTGVFLIIWRQCLATTAHSALPVCKWPTLAMPWATARSNAASAVCSRCGGACTGCCSTAGQVVVFRGSVVFLMLKFARCGGPAWQPQHTEPCHCVSGQLWACHEPLQGQTQPLRCAAGLVELALGAETGLGRWFVVGADLLNAGVLQMCRRYSATTVHRALPVCELTAWSISWATALSNSGFAVCSR